MKAVLFAAAFPMLMGLLLEDAEAGDHLLSNHSDIVMAESGRSIAGAFSDAGTPPVVAFKTTTQDHPLNEHVQQILVNMKDRHVGGRRAEAEENASALLKMQVHPSDEAMKQLIVNVRNHKSGGRRATKASNVDGVQQASIDTSDERIQRIIQEWSNKHGGRRLEGKGGEPFNQRSSAKQFVRTGFEEILDVKEWKARGGGRQLQTVSSEFSTVCNSPSLEYALYGYLGDFGNSEAVCGPCNTDDPEAPFIPCEILNERCEDNVCTQYFHFFEFTSEGEFLAVSTCYFYICTDGTECPLATCYNVVFDEATEEIDQCFLTQEGATCSTCYTCTLDTGESGIQHDCYTTTSDCLGGYFTTNPFAVASGPNPAPVGEPVVTPRPTTRPVSPPVAAPVPQPTPVSPPVAVPVPQPQPTPVSPPVAVPVPQPTARPVFSPVPTSAAPVGISPSVPQNSEFRMVCDSPSLEYALYGYLGDFDNSEAVCDPCNTDDPEAPFISCEILNERCENNTCTQYFHIFEFTSEGEFESVSTCYFYTCTDGTECPLATCYNVVFDEATEEIDQCFLSQEGATCSTCYPCKSETGGIGIQHDCYTSTSDCLGGYFTTNPFADSGPSPVATPRLTPSPVPPPVATPPPTFPQIVQAPTLRPLAVGPVGFIPPNAGTAPGSITGVTSPETSDTVRASIGHHFGSVGVLLMLMLTNYVI